MYTLTQLEPEIKTVGTVENYDKLLEKVTELAGGCEVTRVGGCKVEAVYFSLSDGREYEGYNHG